MPTLRLVDPNGYTAATTDVPDIDVATATAQLRTVVAAEHARETGHGYDARLYQVVTDPTP